MEPFRLRSLCVLALVIAAANPVESTGTAYLGVTAEYGVVESCKAHISTKGPPVVVKATQQVGGSACVDPTVWTATDTTCAKGLDDFASATSCSTTDGTSNGEFVKDKLPALFGDGTTYPYVAVEEYTSCNDATSISKVTAYLADGNCNSYDDTKFYKAVTNDAGAKVRFYTTADCSTLATDTPDASSLTVLSAQLSTCTAERKMIVYTSGTTPSFLKMTMTYDASAGSCTTPAVPDVVSMATLVDPLLVSFKINWVGSTMCTDLASTLLTTSATFLTDMTTAFNSKPFVVVETYGGSDCKSTALTDIKVYWADGNCHKKDLTTSYRAVRNADKSAKIQFYTGTACASLEVGATALTTLAADKDSVCDGTSKVYGSLPRVNVMTYADAAACTSAPGVPADTKMYWADSSCRRKDTTTWYKAARTASGSSVSFFTNSACTTAGTGSIPSTADQDTCPTGEMLRVRGYDGKTPVFYLSTKTYDSATSSCKLPAVPNLVSAVTVVDPLGTACKTTSACASTESTSTLCSSSESYLMDVTAVFNAQPFVTVETYIGTGCAATAITGVKSYWADGNCHKKATGSYRAVRNADKSAKIQFYSDAACLTPGTAATDVISITAVQDNTCVGTTKVYGLLTTPVFFVSTKTYDSATGSCTSAAVPNLLSAVKVDPVSATCKTTGACAGTAFPFTSTLCNPLSSLAADMDTAFGSKPYVIVESYAPAVTATSSVAAIAACKELSSITTYLADGNCHKKDLTTSYRAVRASGSAKVQLYTDAACTTTNGALVSVNDGTSCSSTTNSKTYGSSTVTPDFFLSTKNYDTVADCKAPKAPNLVSGESVDPFSDSCKPATACSGTGPIYASTSCGPSVSYRDDMTTIFKSNPYVIAYTYDVVAAGATPCTTLSNTKTYLADGVCRKLTSTTTYRATVEAATGAVSIKTYNDLTCTAELTSITQTGTDAANHNCVSNTKMYSFGVTPFYLTSTKIYNVSSTADCTEKLLPVAVTTSADYTDTCKPETTCTTVLPYTSKVCGSVATYLADIATMFGSNPYLIMEKYTDTGCTSSKLLSITAYLADGICHQTATALSYRAVRKVDGSAKIYPFGSADCTTSSAQTVITVTAEQVADGQCSSGKTVVYGAGATRVYLKTTKTYLDTTAKCMAPTGATGVVTEVSNVFTCVPTATTSAEVSCETGFTSVVCGSIASYKADMTVALTSTTPFVIVEKYNTGKQCAATELAEVATYVADGSCHAIGSSKSYVATRTTDGAATVFVYAGSTDCTTASEKLIVTAAQAKTNSCTDGTNGVLDTKVSGNGNTPSVFASKLYYGTNSGGCKSPAVPTQVTTTKMSSCTASSSCGSAGPPYAGGTYCSSILTYETDVAGLFGSSPYVVVETYTDAKSCAAAELTGIKSYLADGKCHTSGATASYVATRAADGSATVTTYADSSSCATETGESVTITGTQENTCASNMVVYGGGVTPLYLTSTKSYASTANSCSAPAVPVHVATTVEKLDTCTPTSVCGGNAASYTSKLCSTATSYKSDLAAEFGLSPYIIMEAYAAGKSCAAAELTGITTYLADGVCHATGTEVSYRASRSADGSVKITPYTDGTCGSDSAAAPIVLTAKQAAGNTCATDDSGMLDTKVYADGVTPWFLTSTKTYAAKAENCQSPGVPTQVVTEVSNVDTCLKTDKCSETEPYTSAACSSLSTYKADMTTAFGSSPYVVVKTYNPNNNCAVSALKRITAYLADGDCHAAGGKSYAATRASDGSVVVITYTDDACKNEDNVLSATKAQVTGNSCEDGERGILDTRIGGSGTTPSVFSSQAIYDLAAGNCTPPAVPIQVLTTTGDASKCPAVSSCGGNGTLFTGTSCSSILTLNADMTALFASNAFVTVEKYAADAECAADKIKSITSYLADGKCHATGALSSYTATRTSDGAATVRSYATSATCGVAVVTEAPSTAPTTAAPAGATTTTATTPAASASAPTTTAPTPVPTEVPTAEVPITITVTAAQVGTCANDMKVSGGGPFGLKSTVSYDAAGCRGTPTQVSTELAGEACVSTSCAATALSATKCGSTATHANDVSSWYGTNPYVVVETYDGEKCVSTALTGIRSFLADGKCHKTATSTTTADADASYQAAWKADGSVRISTYASTACTGTPATENLKADCQGTKFVYGSGVPTLYFTTTKTYAGSTCKTTGTNVPIGVTTTVDSFGPCTDTAADGCIGTTKTGQVCSSALAEYKTDMGTVLGTSTPYVIVETYTTGKKCDLTALSAITTYIADGGCHILDVNSYMATRAADGSAVIITYTSSTTCNTAGKVLTVSLDQATVNSCADDGLGLLDKKVSGSGNTKSVFSSKLTYDTNIAGGCKSPAVPTQVYSTKIATTCTASAICTGSGPFTGTSCSSILTYKEDIASLFGSSPYVVVETYNEGKACDPTELKSTMVYLADNICHKTGTTASYLAIRYADLSAEIKTFANALCEGTPTVNTVAAGQVTGNTCVDNTKVYGGGVTPTYLSLTVNYDSNANSCKSLLPSLVTANVVAARTCASPTVCTGSAAPYTATNCSSSLAYSTDMAKVFGSNPYVVIENYVAAGGSCAALVATDPAITTYLADGKCHKTGKLNSYLATRLKDGTAKVTTYSRSARCTEDGDSSTTDVKTVTVTAPEAPAAFPDGCVLNQRAYGKGVTPQYLSSTLYFASSSASCKSGAPIQVSTKMVDFDACSATASCAGQAAPFTSIRCGSTNTYATDLVAIFGSSPYVAVETYTTTTVCDPTRLLGITVYLADGQCHAIATKSYTATRASDGSATVTTYDDSTSCDTEGEILPVTAAQAKGNSCAAGTAGIPDTKVYGAGATTTLWSAVSVFDANSCAIPAQITLTSQYSCSAVDCLELGTRSMSYACSSDYLTAASTVFGTSPYIVAEMYEEGDDTACGLKEGVIAYVADTSCHLTIDGLASFTARLSTDGSGAIVLYEDNTCQDVAPATMALTKDQLASSLCIGSTKFSAFNKPSGPTDPPATKPPTPSPSTNAPSPPTTPAPTTVAPTPTTTTSTGSAQSGATSLTPPLVTVLAFCVWVVSLLL